MLYVLFCLHYLAEMKVILEFVPNHSSDQHPWFLESKKSKDNEYADFYVWADGNGNDPPNDWVSSWTCHVTIMLHGGLMVSVGKKVEEEIL